MSCARVRLAASLQLLAPYACTSLVCARRTYVNTCGQRVIKPTIPSCPCTPSSVSQPCAICQPPPYSSPQRLHTDALSIQLLSRRIPYRRSAMLQRDALQRVPRAHRVLGVFLSPGGHRHAGRAAVGACQAQGQFSLRFRLGASAQINGVSSPANLILRRDSRCARLGQPMCTLRTADVHAHGIACGWTGDVHARTLTASFSLRLARTAHVHAPMPVSPALLHMSVSTLILFFNLFYFSARSASAVLVLLVLAFHKCAYVY